MIFASKKEDLTAIYETYLRREKGKLITLGYELEGKVRVDKYTEFVLRRTAPPAWKL